MLDTCSLFSPLSSLPSNLNSSSENRSHPQPSLDEPRKVCTVCGKDKPIGQYRKYSGSGKFGKRPLCRECQRTYERKWRSANPEYRREQRRRRADKAATYSREHRAKFRAQYLAAECRRRSAKKGLAFDLDAHLPQLQARINAGICELTGVALDLNPWVRDGRYSRKWNAPSFDRIDPKAGYVYWNVRVVAFAANAMLGDWGEEATLAMVRSWLRRRGERE